MLFDADGHFIPKFAHMNVAKAVDGLASISDEARHALTWGDAQRFFGLPESVATGQPLAAAGE